MAAYILSSDPRYSPTTGINESGEYEITNAPPHEQVWMQLAKEAGVEPTIRVGYGQGENFEYKEETNPAYTEFVNDLKAKGIDIGMQDIPGIKYTKNFFILENGQPITEAIPVKTGQGLFSSISGTVKELAPVLLPALTAGLGGPLAAALGVSQPVAAGLISGGVTALGGGDIGDIVKAGLTSAAGSYATNALAGGDSLLTPEMQATISSNPQGAFLGESAIPYPVAPQPTITGYDLGALATPVTDVTGVANALASPAADAMTGVDMSGNVVNALTGEVIAPAAAAGGIDLSSIPQGIQEGMAPGVTAAVTPEELAAVGAVTGAGAAGAGALEGTDAAMADLAGSTQITPNAMAAATAAGTTLGVSDALWGPIIGSIASLYGGSQMANAASEAAQTQAAAYNRALDLQEQMYKEGVARQAPFLQGGTEAFNRLTALSTGGPEAAQNFLTMDPGYGFRLGEGMKALERLQASRGSLLSGGAIKAGQRYAQDVASQEYGNAYNRLAQLADVGPRAAGVTSQLGQNYATSAGNLMSQQGTGSANALLTGAAARQSAYGDIGNLWGRYFGGGK